MKIYKFVTTLIAFFFICSNLAGNDSIIVKHLNDIEIGNSLNECFEINFSDKIDKYRYSNDGNLLIYSLSNSKRIYCLDYNNKIIKWDYASNPLFFNIIDTTLVLREKAQSDKLKYLNIYNGRINGQNEVVGPFYYYPNSNLGFYSVNHGRPCIVDFTIGQEFWKLPDSFKTFTGLHDIKIINNDIYLLSNNLFKLNRETGFSWSFELNDTENPKFNRFCGISTNEQLFCIYPWGVVIPVMHDTKGVRSGLLSNILVVMDKIYVADNSKIFCIDKLTGKQIWQNDLDFKTGCSELINLDSAILLINRASSEINDKIIDYGQPYISLIDKKDGKKIKTIKIDSNTRMEYVKNYSDKVLLLLKDKVVSINKNDLSLKIGDISKYGNVQSFSSNYELNENEYLKFNRIVPQDIVSDKLDLFEITNNEIHKINNFYKIPVNKGVLVFNENLEDFRLISFKQLGICKFKNAKYNIILPLGDYQDWNNASLIGKLYFSDNENLSLIKEIDVESGTFWIVNDCFVQLFKKGIKIIKLK